MTCSEGWPAPSAGEPSQQQAVCPKPSSTAATERTIRELVLCPSSARTYLVQKDTPLAFLRASLQSSRCTPCLT